MMLRFVSVIALCLAVTTVADASGKRRQRATVYGSTNAVVQPTNTVVQATGEECKDALEEVNAKRASLGLKPFVNDPLLAQAAYACARERARTRTHGHIDDFAYLPAGAVATATGCGALDDSWGWATCCYRDNYTIAGAAWVRGADGLRYMSLFVR